MFQLLFIIYLAFISLGLPDSILGSAWPIMHLDLGVGIQYAGPVQILISAGTIACSLYSDKLTRRWGTGKVTAYSVALTAVSLLGFSFSSRYWMLLLWALPYGLGAGGVDAALNNYVAIHYTSRHMSWLHCMWGIGASLGPVIMGGVLTHGFTWPWGYRLVAGLQFLLTFVLFLNLDKWEKRSTTVVTDTGDELVNQALSLKEVLAVPGVRAVVFTFFCYSSIESTAILWGTSFLVGRYQLPPERAARLGALFVMGMTVGRALNGFLTMKFSDAALIRGGQTLLFVGILTLLLPLGFGGDVWGLVCCGLGAAPVYPCIIHQTPSLFGPDRSQAIVGVEMALAYLGGLIMPAGFGFLTKLWGLEFFPLFLLILFLIMVVLHESVIKQTKTSKI